jgi:dephospho-CoA kinase
MTTQLGLTGGIGSGKSTVAALFAECGASIIDADAISRQSTASGGSAITAIERAFGAVMLASDGSLDRDAMRALIFSHPEAKAQLESIIHPLVGQTIAAQQLAAVQAGHRLVVLDIPLLVESSHWRPKLDAVVVVDCAVETQIQRVMQRSQWTRAQVEQVIAAQASRQQRLAAADAVICNDGIDLATLKLQVRETATLFGL